MRGRKKGSIPWNKGLSKFTDERVKLNGKKTSIGSLGKIITEEHRNSISKSMKGIKRSKETKEKMRNSKLGIKNPMFGKNHTEETKKKHSEKIRKMILEGKFTPQIKNSLTHLQIHYKGKKFRSSWEAAFFSLNETLIYEKVRIKYFDSVKNKHRIYIIDFCDDVNRFLYEIRPIENQNEIDKFNAANIWCNQNGFKFIIIDQNWFIKNMKHIESSDLPEIVKDKIRKIK